MQSVTDNPKNSKNLLITGGAGFIASNFIYYWKRNHPKDKIIVLDLLSYSANINSIKSLINKKTIEFIHGNINDQNLVSKILKDFKITDLINFAAETHVDRSIKNPSIFFETNVIGTFNLLDCFKRNWEINDKPKNWRFLHISTDEVFGSLGNYGTFNELTRYDPRSPYSASKASSDHIVNAWYHTYGLPIMITNCSNNYGPWQNTEKLIPKIIYNAINNLTIPIYGNGENIRDWLFVEDHVDGLFKVINESKVGQKYCIGGNEEKTNNEVVYRICEILDKSIPKENSYKDLITFVEDRLGHDKRYAIDASKIKSELDWFPKYSFEEGLKITVNWYINKFKKINK